MFGTKHPPPSALPPQRQYHSVQLAGQLEELADAAAADPAAVTPLRRAEPIGLAAAAAAGTGEPAAHAAAVQPQPGEQQPPVLEQQQPAAQQQQHVPAVVPQQHAAAAAKPGGPRACPLAEPVPWGELPKDPGGKRAAVFSAYDIVSRLGAG